MAREPHHVVVEGLVGGLGVVLLVETVEDRRLQQDELVVGAERHQRGQVVIVHARNLASDAEGVAGRTVHGVPCTH